MIVHLLSPELHLRIVGVLLILLAAVNMLMPIHFAWPAELQRLSLLTRQVFIVHLLFIILLLVLMGVLALVFAPFLLDRTPLATGLLFGLSLFWLVRLAVQFFVYSPKLWRGNRFHTSMHILFSCVWVYFSTVFTTAWILSIR